MRLTRAQTMVMWRYYFAMRMRFDEHRPPKPTKEQWSLIQAAQTQPVTKRTLDALRKRGLMTFDRVWRLTKPGLAEIANRREEEACDG